MRLNRTGELLSDHEYPTTSDELIDAYGETRIELQDGSESLATIFDRMGSETFTSANEAHETLLSGVGHEAVGRRYYSDRDAPTVGEDGPKPLSF